MSQESRVKSQESRKTPIVFFGNERIATGVTTEAPTLRALIKAGFDVKAVVSNFERGVSRNTRDLEIMATARQYNIPVLLPDKPSDIIDQLKSFRAEIAVLVAYGRIVPQSVIDIFPKGIINIHPSLLPAHRGPIPLESVILSGENKTGVSVMQLVRAMDAGPVYEQRELALNGSETKQDLANKLLNIGSSMVIELLPKILNGNITAVAQDDTRATYDQLIKKEDGRLNWNKSAEQLEREIRAYIEWPKSYTTFGDIEVIITQAHAVPSNFSEVVGEVEIQDDETKLLMVNCKNGYLCIDKLKPAGKKEMSVREFLAGYKDRI